jgi:hypothetical protein
MYIDSKTYRNNDTPTHSDYRQQLKGDNRVYIRENGYNLSGTVRHECRTK